MKERERKRLGPCLPREYGSDVELTEQGIYELTTIQAVEKASPVYCRALEDN